MQVRLHTSDIWFQYKGLVETEVIYVDKFYVRSLFFVSVIGLACGCATSVKDQSASQQRNIAGIQDKEDVIYLIACESEGKLAPLELLDFYEESTLAGLEIEMDTKTVLINMNRVAPELGKKVEHELTRIDDYDFSSSFKDYWEIPTAELGSGRNCKYWPHQLTFAPEREFKNSLSRDIRLTEQQKRGILIHYLIWRDDLGKKNRTNSRLYRHLTGVVNSQKFKELSPAEYAALVKSLGLSR